MTTAAQRFPTSSSLAVVATQHTLLPQEDWQGKGCHWALQELWTIYHLFDSIPSSAELVISAMLSFASFSHLILQQLMFRSYFLDQWHYLPSENKLCFGCGFHLQRFISSLKSVRIEGPWCTGKGDGYCTMSCLLLQGRGLPEQRWVPLPCQAVGISIFLHKK